MSSADKKMPLASGPPSGKGTDNSSRIVHGAVPEAARTIDIARRSGFLWRGIQRGGHYPVKKYEKPSWQKRERLSAVTAQASPSSGSTPPPPP
jgi:hypothetical protein